MSESENTVPDPASTLRHSTLMMLVFWLVLAAVLWAGFSWWEQRQRAAIAPYQQSGGELVIPRAPGGHFYVDGKVNHQPVRFMVDTGASGVSITSATARAAGLPKGTPITVRTANGERAGWVVQGVPVKAGPLVVNEVRVIVGMTSDEPDEGLLGQSFLRHFDVQIGAEHMTLRPRALQAGS